MNLGKGARSAAGSTTELASTISDFEEVRLEDMSRSASGEEVGWSGNICPWPLTRPAAAASCEDTGMRKWRTSQLEFCIGATAAMDFTFLLLLQARRRASPHRELSLQMRQPHTRRKTRRVTPGTRLLQRLPVRTSPQTMLRLQGRLSQRSAGEAHAQVTMLLLGLPTRGCSGNEYWTA